MSGSATGRGPNVRRVVFALLLLSMIGGAAALGMAYGERWRGQVQKVLGTASKTSASAAVGTDMSSQASRGFDHVHALGRLEPRGRLIRLAPPTGQEAARVEELFVAEGDAVKTGDVLARMDTWNRRKAVVSESEAARAAAESRLVQTRAGAKPAEINAQKEQVTLLEQQAKMAKRELDRAKVLVGKKALSNEEFDNKQWEYDRLIIEQRRAEQQLIALAEVRDTDVRVRELELASAEAALATARTSLVEAELLAPSAGRILKIHARPGEKVGEKGILELGDVDHMEAVAEVFEGDVSRLVLGQSAEVLIDGTGDRLQGTVLELGYIVGRKVVLTNDPVSDTDARILEVRVTLSAEDALRVARLANARIEVRISTAAPPTKP